MRGEQHGGWGHSLEVADGRVAPDAPHPSQLVPRYCWVRPGEATGEGRCEQVWRLRAMGSSERV